MKPKNLYLMCGVPGCGKSTWIKNHISEYPNSIHISRDTVRFNMVGENEDYFSKEKEVFNKFIELINEAFESYDNIFVDATHVNSGSRNKVLDSLNLENVNIIPINFDIPLVACIERNKNRSGRERVPEDAIRRMYQRFRPATFNEKYHYEKIINVKKGD